MFFLSVRMKQLCYHWTDFHEIWYLRIFRKSRNSSLIKMWQGLRIQILPFMRECEKIRYSQKCHRCQCNAAQKRCKNIGSYSWNLTLIAFPSNNGYTNVPQCYVIRTLPVLFIVTFLSSVLSFDSNCCTCYFYCLWPLSCPVICVIIN